MVGCGSGLIEGGVTTACPESQVASVSTDMASG